MYQRLFTGRKLAKQRELKQAILVDKKELLETSAQDQFAKWAKLRRRIDKELADLEKLSKSSVIRIISAFLTYNRLGSRYGTDVVLAQVQLGNLDSDYWRPVRHWMVVSEISCLLRPPRLVWSGYVVA